MWHKVLLGPVVLLRAVVAAFKDGFEFGLRKRVTTLSIFFREIEAGCLVAGHPFLLKRKIVKLAQHPQIVIHRFV